ncbi:MAG TPA: hypothetical protein VNL15_02420 [Dehalococcoidia bacterium]|nr:hypothetical protein [Dehalococcoidia bacterium]
MEGVAFVVLVAIAAAIGGLGDVVATYLTERGGPITAIRGSAAALLGAFAWSEWFGKASDWGGNIEGLHVLPAILGAVILSAAQIVNSRTLEEASLVGAQPEEQL